MSIEIDKDLSPPVQGAIAAAQYDGAGKIGLQFKRRFWEEDDEIHGGRSWTDQEVGQIIYPSHGVSTARGLLVGYYLDFRGRMRGRAPAEIERLALEQGSRVYPQYSAEFEHAFSVTWGGFPGAGGRGGPNRTRRIRSWLGCANRTDASISPATT
jgi:monoamine oxidase